MSLMSQAEFTSDYNCLEIFPVTCVTSVTSGHKKGGLSVDVQKILERVNIVQSYTLEVEGPDTIDSLIRNALEKINENYEAGTLEWLRKNRPQERQRCLALEEDINEAALREDIEVLRRVLTEYKDLMLSAARKFRPKE